MQVTTIATLTLIIVSDCTGVRTIVTKCYYVCMICRRPLANTAHVRMVKLQCDCACAARLQLINSGGGSNENAINCATFRRCYTLATMFWHATFFFSFLGSVFSQTNLSAWDRENLLGEHNRLCGMVNPTATNMQRMVRILQLRWEENFLIPFLTPT